MHLDKLPRRRAALLGLCAGCLFILTAIALTSGRSAKLPVGTKLLAGKSAAGLSSVLLSATNQTSHDYAFSCWLELKTKSGWSDVSPSDDIRTLRYFQKSEVIQLEVGLPSKEGVYRFHCYYEPLWGPTRATELHTRLMALRLPGKLGAFYRQCLGRLAPWPKSLYSKVFELKANAQPTD